MNQPANSSDNSTAEKGNGQSRERTVVAIGNPNTGKSTLFTALTGVHSRIGNYPGVTVEKKLGWLQDHGHSIRLVDLPGTYSLSPRTLDEIVSVDVLLGRQADVGQIDAVVCIADASNLERNLYLVSQVLDLGLPTVLVLNMWDVAKQRGVQIDTAELAKRLGVTVVTCEAHRRKQVEEVRAAIIRAAEGAARTVVDLFPAGFRKESKRLRDQLGKLGEQLPEALVDRLLLDVGGQYEANLVKRHPSLAGILNQSRLELQNANCKIPNIEAKTRYAWIRKTLTGVMAVPAARPSNWTDVLDKWLTHKVWGMLAFCLIMFAVFQAITNISKPIMDLFELGQKHVGDWIGDLLPVGPLRSLAVDGVIGGVGGILVFLPQICFLFLFIALLEDCGYMARAAFLMDKLMTKVGLSGKSFVPLMSSFACAIPGIMATRTIEHRRDRMVTILIAPLMSCSARAPVYWLMVASFFPEVSWAGGFISLHAIMLLVMTFFGAIVAVPIAWLFKKTLFRGEAPPFVLELPSFKWPSLRIVIHRVFERANEFVTQAGTLILATSILIWFASYFPGNHAEQESVMVEIRQTEEQLADAIGEHAHLTLRQGELASQPNSEQSQLDRAEVEEDLAAVDTQLAPLNALYEQRNRLSERLLTESYLGRFGKLIEPAVIPLGWDWRIGVGVIASFPAREVIIATLGTIYSLGGDVDENHTGLQSALKSANWPDGRPVYSIPVALSIMVFFALCAQCASTLMVIRRETNHWGWAAFTFIYMTTLAYLAAWLIYVVSSQFLS